MFLCFFQIVFNFFFILSLSSRYNDRNQRKHKEFSQQTGSAALSKLFNAQKIYHGPVILFQFNKRSAKLSFNYNKLHTNLTLLESKSVSVLYVLKSYNQTYIRLDLKGIEHYLSLPITIFLDLLCDTMSSSFVLLDLVALTQLNSYGFSSADVRHLNVTGTSH